MPGHESHTLIDELFFGKKHGKVHDRMDQPTKILGKRHRIFFHDMQSIMALFNGNPEQLMSAYIHILLDETCSQNRDFKKMLELIAKQQKT